MKRYAVKRDDKEKILSILNYDEDKKKSYLKLTRGEVRVSTTDDRHVVKLPSKYLCLYPQAKADLSRFAVGNS